MKSGEEQAWSTLKCMNPADVMSRSGASFDSETEEYTIDMFTRRVCVSLRDRSIKSASEDAGFLLDRLRYLSRLSILSYLANAKDIVPSGHWVKPADIRGLVTYFDGSHELPLPAIAAKYGSNRVGFVQKAEQWGGMAVDNGDAAVCLFPFARFPVMVILWLADEEFPARAEFLFDSTCVLHVPADIMWSIAMLSVLVLQ